MVTPATGLFKSVAFKTESSFGTLAGTSGAQYLRRTQSTLNAEAAFFKSAEINLDRQLRDARKGAKGIKGNINGELSPGTYSVFMAAMLGAAAAWASAVTTGAQTDIAAVAGPPGTFTTAGSVNFLTLGFKIGDLIRCSGWTTTAAANNARNYRVTGVSATVLTVGTAATGASGQPEAVAAKAAGDAVTIFHAGKKLVTPASSLTDLSFTIEHWHSDIGKSEVFTGCKPTSMALNMPATAIATVQFGFMGQDIVAGTTQYFTTPTALTSANLTAGVNGKLSINGVDFATVTGLSINVNGNHAVEAVVGSQLTPGVFPGILDVTGQVTALFDSTTLRDAFLAETEVSLNAVLVLTSALNSDFILFNIPRLKFTGSSKDDKSQALVQTLPFQALLNTAGGAGIGSSATTLEIMDSLAA